MPWDGAQNECAALGVTSSARGNPESSTPAVRQRVGGDRAERDNLDPDDRRRQSRARTGDAAQPEERAEVANALDGMSADAPALSPDDLAAAWRPELDRRREELERGEVQTVDAREAIAGIRARLRSGT